MRSNVVHHSEGVGQLYSHNIGHGSDRCDAIAGKTKSYGHRESAIAACQPSEQGNEHEIAFDWLALRRLKSFGFVEETQQGPKITAAVKRAIGGADPRQ